MEFKEIVLQERRTLDDVLLTGVVTFKNGCNFKLIWKHDMSVWLTLGCCYSTCTNDEDLVMEWLYGGPSAGGPDYEPITKELTGYARPETLRELLKRTPCAICGGDLFEGPPTKKLGGIMGWIAEGGPYPSTTEGTRNEQNKSIN